jgi:hypothetical protein
LAAGKWESSVEERRSPLANAKVRQEIAVFRRKTPFAGRKRRSRRPTPKSAGRLPFSAGKRRSPPENAVRRRKTAFSAGKRRSPQKMLFSAGKHRSLAENAVFRWKIPFSGRKIAMAGRTTPFNRLKMSSLDGMQRNRR